MKRSGLMLLAAMVTMALLTVGCGNEKLKTFLQQPRSPISGTPYAETYHVLPPDVIGVYSVRVIEINAVRQMVRPDGMINLPLIGEIRASDLTPKQIQTKIEEACKKYYTEVDATVQVEAFNSQKVYVFGQVVRPGPQPWNGANTLLDALAQSTPTPSAWPERIKVVRGARPTRGGVLKHKEAERLVEQAESAEAPGVAKPKTVAEETVPKPGEKPAPRGEQPKKKDELPADTDQTKAVVMIVNMKQMVERGDLSKNVLLQPDDVVYVPANPLAWVGLALQQILSPYSQSIDAYTDYYTAKRAAAGTSYNRGGYGP
jgi:protein involved in polysaccharide export with SLBB domain